MDKTILSAAILDVIDEGKELGTPWQFSEGQFADLGENAEAVANAERLIFVERVTRRYFEVMRIELAKDGN